VFTTVLATALAAAAAQQQLQYLLLLEVSEMMFSLANCMCISGLSWHLLHGAHREWLKGIRLLTSCLAMPLCYTVGL
jgi:hypothetical protein